MQRFVPVPTLAGPHAQTLGARILRSRAGVSLRRERVELPDGDFLDLDWAVVNGGHQRPDRGLVLVLHGLEGSAASKYVLEVHRRLSEAGVESVGLNFRCCSGELNRLARMYHSGETGDLGLVLRQLRSRFPERPLGAIGFSLGGNVLLKYLGEADGDRGVRAAAAISVPYDLMAGSDFMERGFARVYVRWLLASLKAKLVGKRRLLAGRIDLDAARRATTFRAFDDAATAPLHGFRNADDYYRRASSGPFLPAIEVPTLLVHARDDPFLPASAIPSETMHANPALTPVVESRGGHVGFIAGTLRRPVFWAERLAAVFVAKQLSVNAAR